MNGPESLADLGRISRVRQYLVRKLSAKPMMLLRLIGFRNLGVPGGKSRLSGGTISGGRAARRSIPWMGFNTRWSSDPVAHKLRGALKAQ